LCFKIPKYIDDLGESYGPSRVTRRVLGFDGYYAHFDDNGVCGAVSGDRLERGGVPILATGDKPGDVERLLGQPTGRAILYGRARDKCQWLYSYPAFTLTVGFADDRVEDFLLQMKDFARVSAR